LADAEGIGGHGLVSEQSTRASASRSRRAPRSLDQSGIPPKSLDRNVLIGTWNIRGFGRVLDKWESAATDSPKRNLRDVLCLAEVISRFDVVALQEVKRDLDGLRRLMEALGPNWGWILTDFTRGTPGNQERMAFVFDLRRVRPSGLAAELVVPIENETSLTEVKLEKQFARTPYAVSFESQGTTFTLVTLHVLWGKNAQERLPEITEIAKWLRRWTDGEEEFGENLMAPRRLQHRPIERPALSGLHQHRAAPGARARWPAAHDLPRPRGRALLRPDRLVREAGRHGCPDGAASLREAGRQLRLPTGAAGTAVEHSAQLANLRPLPVVGELFGAKGVSAVRR
jgi:hypothetical protein